MPVGLPQVSVILMRCCKVLVPYWVSVSHIIQNCTVCCNSADEALQVRSHKMESLLICCKAKGTALLGLCVVSASELPYVLQENGHFMLG